MRKYDIPYVQNVPAQYYPAVPLQEMTLEEIKQKHIKTCAKANGDVSECSRCKSPCPEGQRATQLVANMIYNDPPIPLYGGKTLIEKAKEENMKRREEKEKIEESKKVTKNKRIYIDGWYEQAMASADPVAWVMEAYACSKTKAKQKIYCWKNRHPEANETHPEESETPVIKETQESQTQPKIETKKDKFEVKLEALMKQQEEQKKAMDEYMKLYQQAKVEYEKIKQKTDVLCNALDILDE